MLDRINPFDKCPIYETNQLIYRLVEEDAEDLLKFYSDNESAKIFNSDNCNSNFVHESIEVMRKSIDELGVEVVDTIEYYNTKDLPVDINLEIEEEIVTRIINNKMI